MISAFVYLMCASTSTLCALLLYWKYRKNRTPLLLWSAVCFFGLALNNTLLFTDVILVPHIDLSVIRTLPAAIGLMALMWGFIWESS